MGEQTAILVVLFIAQAVLAIAAIVSGARAVRHARKARQYANEAIAAGRTHRLTHDKEEQVDKKQLRRRIECVMIKAETRNGGQGTYASAAQAVIDDLGLEPEIVEQWADTRGRSGIVRFRWVGGVEYN